MTPNMEGRGEVSCSESGPPSPSGSSGSGNPNGLKFFKHKVTKLDTLAGLAIKHNISVGDIKRANGLLSDTAMYARDTILIPNQHLPLGQELQDLFAQVLTGASRDPVLHAESRTQPASAAVARIATKLNMVNSSSYPEDLPVSDVAWLAMYQCGACSYPDLDNSGRGHRRAGSVAAGSEVELADRSSEGAYMAPASSSPPASASGARESLAGGGGDAYGASDAMRRRRAAFDDRRSCSDSAEDYGGYGDHHQAGHGGASKGPGRPKAGPGLGGGTTWGSSSALGASGAGDAGHLKSWFAGLGKAIGDSVQQTVQKVKDAANQPALARPAAMNAGFGSAADGVLSSMSSVPRPSAGGGGNVSYRKAGATVGRAPFDAAAAPPLPRPKVGKAD